MGKLNEMTIELDGGRERDIRGIENNLCVEDIDLSVEKKPHHFKNDPTLVDNCSFCQLSINRGGINNAGPGGEVVNGVGFKPNKDPKRKPTRRRLVEKNGTRNVRSKHIPRERYMQDVFTTLIDAKWKWIILLFLSVYLGSWVIFAFFWWLIILIHGNKCVDNVHNFTESFLLSVETAMTIGYGGRAVTSQCTEGVVLLIFQALVACLIDAVIIGLVFTKIARPGKRQSTIIFSENAVITKRDDKFCLMFRVADVRKRQLSECHIRLYLYRTYKTLEGRIVPNHQDQLRVGCDWYNIRDDSDRLFLLDPCTVTHVIDRKSPFYNMSFEKFSTADWEIVAVLEGNVEATGCTMQTRTSYLPSEILWGYDFIDLVKMDDWIENVGLRYRINKLNDMEIAPYVPRCSPREFYVKVNKDPDPNDVLGEQDELWDDQNFTLPSDEDRVLASHKNININNGYSNGHSHVEP